MGPGPGLEPDMGHRVAAGVRAGLEGLRDVAVVDVQAKVGALPEILHDGLVLRLGRRRRGHHGAPENGGARACDPAPCRGFSGVVCAAGRPARDAQAMRFNHGVLPLFTLLIFRNCLSSSAHPVSAPVLNHVACTAHHSISDE